jgi:HSP20 family protein
MATYLTTRRQADPFQGLRRLTSMLDDAFNLIPQQRDEGNILTANWMPACDISEDKDGVRIVAEIPGVRPEDVRISLENNLLTIRGEKKQEAEERGDRVLRYERTYGVFERTFALPSTVDPERIEARYDNGVLTIFIPKAERARPREIEVKVSHDGQDQLNQGRQGQLGDRQAAQGQLGDRQAAQGQPTQQGAAAQQGGSTQQRGSTQQSGGKGDAR